MALLYQQSDKKKDWQPSPRGCNVIR
jgi:hypothetical protein